MTALTLRCTHGQSSSLWTEESCTVSLKGFFGLSLKVKDKVVDYFEKLSLFSAGIDRLSTFINRVNEGGWQSEQSFTPTVQHSQMCTSVVHNIQQFARSLGRSFLSRFGVKIKIVEYDYAKVNSDQMRYARFIRLCHCIG